MISHLEQAACWFAHSGIQEPGGGVARYYRSDLERNAPVSAEITGYAVSTFAWLHSLDRSAGPSAFQQRNCSAALRAARYLADRAWDETSHTFPFEAGSGQAYFFDLGIIARGLMAACRLSGDEHFRERARQAALSLAFDFLGDGVFHPVISLPDKQPLACDHRWSRNPGCYQLKSALAWREIGDEHASKLFDLVLDRALATHETFLSGESEQLMDRLHAYCYFLEALLAVAERPEIRRVLDAGIRRVGALLRAISSDFERSDVCAQLLRIRLIAHHLGAVPLDEPNACEEAERAASYQSPWNEAADPRLRGGYWFGRKRGDLLPFVNPVSTAFCLQALALWEAHRAGSWRFELHELI